MREALGSIIVAKTVRKIIKLSSEFGGSGKLKVVGNIKR